MPSVDGQPVGEERRSSANSCKLPLTRLLITVLYERKIVFNILYSLLVRQFLAAKAEGSKRYRDFTMKLTKSVDYMIRCLLFLAEKAPNTVVARREIVEATDVPDSFFRKIAQELGRAGIIGITRGPRGGYVLIVPPEELTLLRVVEAGMGEIAMNECALDPRLCDRSASCPVHPTWQRIRCQVRQMLEDVNFADLALGAGDRPNA